jgi:hypothetical protein
LLLTTPVNYQAQEKFFQQKAFFQSFKHNFSLKKQVHLSNKFLISVGFFVAMNRFRSLDVQTVRNSASMDLKPKCNET